MVEVSCVSWGWIGRRGGIWEYYDEQLLEVEGDVMLLVVGGLRAIYSVSGGYLPLEGFG